MEGEIERFEALALHQAHKFLSEKNRRILEAAGSFSRFARVLLGQEYEPAVAGARKEWTAIPPAGALAFTDGDYPHLLRECDYAPFFLYLRGARSLLKNELVSVVGTREPTDGGRLAAERIAQHFTRLHRTIVSGIARGIDGIAHHAALRAGGSTIAVLPQGFAHLYPLENRDLYEAAAAGKNILLVSEYPPAQKAHRHHFVRRNRLIAGISPLTVFVEGSLKSGGMITVRNALSGGRDVAALTLPEPHNNAGGEALLADGAEDLTALIFPSGKTRVSA